jgi:hypothetical protein
MCDVTYVCCGADLQVRLARLKARPTYCTANAVFLVLVVVRHPSYFLMARARPQDEMTSRGALVQFGVPCASLDDHRVHFFRAENQSH